MERSRDLLRVRWESTRRTVRHSAETSRGSPWGDPRGDCCLAGRLPLIVVAIAVVVAWATPSYAGHTIEFSQLSPSSNSTIAPGQTVFSFRAEVVVPADPDFPHFMGIEQSSIEFEAWSPAEGWQPICHLLWVDDGASVDNTFEGGLIVAMRFTANLAVDRQCSDSPFPTGKIRVIAGVMTLPLFAKFKTTWELHVAEPDLSDPPSALELARLNPSSGSPSTPVTIAGRGFANGAQALFDGADVPTSRVSDEELRFTAPIDADCGEHDVQVANPERVTNAGILPPEFSNVVTFRVLCETPAPPPVALPRIDGFFPSDRGHPGKAIILRGSGFHVGSAIYWNGNPIDSEYIRDSNGTNLRFEVPSRTACGTHDVGVLNPGPPRAKSNVVAFRVTSPCQGDGAPPPEEPEAPFFEALSLDVPPTVSVGDAVTFEGRVRNAGDADGTANVVFLVEGDTVGETSRSLAAGETRTVTSISYTFSQPGTFTVELRTPDDAISETVSARATTENAPPDTGGQDGLLGLDSNANCTLETSEFLAAIDGWIDRLIGDDLFFEAIDAWIEASDICPSTAGTERMDTLRVHTQATDRAVRFSALHPGVASISVRVFSLEGRRIFASTGNGSRLSWHLRGPDGKPVANGSYLYRVTVHEMDGSVRRSDVRRLIVLR